jgi:plastocyanin
MADIVVWLGSGSPSSPTAQGHAQLLQKKKMFHPHVLPIRRGTVVDFPNADPIFHNAFSNYNGQIFDVGLYPPGTSRSIMFRRAGIVRVFCNIHPAMSAIILVLDTPYFARVHADGTYVMKDVEPGTYDVHWFDERATAVDAKQLQTTVAAEDTTVEIPPIRLSEAGYVQIPHKNKYGRDYPPNATPGSYGDVLR